MADVFYFSSPRKPATASRNRLISSSKVKTGKRRRSAKMDASPQHACMARFDEPTFCSSDLSALLVQYPLLPSEQSRNATTPELMADEEEETDDDEVGGVPLHPTGPNEETTGAFASDLTGHTAGNNIYLPAMHDTDGDSTSILTSDRSMWYVHQLDATPDPVRLPSATSSFPVTVPRIGSPTVLGSSHPRPQSQEFWEEEHGRRLRFALEGTDTSEVPQFADHEDTRMEDEAEVARAPGRSGDLSPNASRPHQRRSDPAIDRSARPTLTHSRSLSNTADEARPAGERAAHGPLTQSYHVAANPIDDHNDDDWMPVDDPRRSYDFADFMDTWRLRSMRDKRIPEFELGMQPSVRLGHRPEEVHRQDVASGDVDMQGLRWPLLGPARSDALAARALLHPSRRAVRMSSTQSVYTTKAHAVDVESSYRLRSFTSLHRAKFSHYQLRNQLAASSRSDVYYAADSKVYHTSLACPLVKQTVMDLSKTAHCAASFRITCLAASPSPAFSAYDSHKLVVAGGFYGEYAILNTSGDTPQLPTEGFATHAYNGLVTHVHAFANRRSGVPQIAFCSNDHRLRLMDTGTSHFTKTFTYADAVNCSATSPDGRLRALVGDSQDAHITDAEKGDVLVTLKGHTDHGFACAWSPNGLHVATGAQDGNVLVWDARNWSAPLRTLPSVMSCPRSLHFTDNDGLVVAEDDDVVSVYEAGNFGKRQDIRFFGSIAGVALLDGGAEIAVANADKTVGGLLTFERTAQGLYGGTFGARLGPFERRSRRRLEASFPSDFTSDVLV